jgi:hypothetical protein
MDNHYEEFMCKYCGNNDYRYVRAITYEPLMHTYNQDTNQYETQYQQVQIVTRQCKLCFSNERGT